jgi:hypothetical protein
VYPSAVGVTARPEDSDAKVLQMTVALFENFPHDSARLIGTSFARRASIA